MVTGLTIFFFFHCFSLSSSVDLSHYLSVWYTFSSHLVLLLLYCLSSSFLFTWYLFQFTVAAGDVGGRSLFYKQIFEVYNSKMWVTNYKAYCVRQRMVIKILSKATRDIAPTGCSLSWFFFSFWLRTVTVGKLKKHFSPNIGHRQKCNLDHVVAYHSIFMLQFSPQLGRELLFSITCHDFYYFFLCSQFSGNIYYYFTEKTCLWLHKRFNTVTIYR